MHYTDFIETYEKLFHIKPCEPISEIYNLISIILISKNKTNSNDFIMSIFMAIKYNYRYFNHYIKILNLYFNQNSITRLRLDTLLDTAKSLNLQFFINDTGIYQVRFIQDTFPKENEIQSVIMNDQIDKIIEFTNSNSIEDICIEVPGFQKLTVLESCCYFGSVNIFNYITSNLKKSISQECLQYSFIGNNNDIINLCLNKHKIDKMCLEYIVASHNHKYLEYVFEKKLFAPKDFDYETIIRSQNLKAVFLMFSKDKNSIIPWCSSFSQTINILQNEKIDFSKKSPDQQTLLHYASAHNNVDICKFLVSSERITPILLNAKDKNDKTSLHIASEYNNKDVVEILIVGCIDINAKNNEGFTALHSAAVYNSKEAAEYLIAHGIDINAKDNYMYSALHWASLNNSIEFVETLILNGADIEVKNKDFQTPLFIASSVNGKEVAECLISHGANIEAKSIDNLTPLFYAVIKNSFDVVEFLILHGADVNVKDKDGDTPLHCSVIMNHANIAKILILHGANVHARNNFLRIPLQNAATKDNIDILELLIHYGSEVNAKDSGGETALHYAVKSNNIEAIKILLSHGADINAKNNIGQTAIYFSV